MSSATFKATVYGDCFDDLVQSAEREICSLLVIDDEDALSKTNYELIISRDEDLEADFDYKAELIARIRYGT